MGAVTKEMEKHKTFIRRGRTEIHRDQATVERFNCTLAERLFGHQYAVEMLLPEGKRSTEWVKRLPNVVGALNNEVTRLTGKKPAVAIKEKSVVAKPSTPYLRPVGVNLKRLPPLINVFVRRHPPGHHAEAAVFCLKRAHVIELCRLDMPFVLNFFLPPRTK